MNEWQPIETAPKDGTAILVCNDQNIMTTVSWLQFASVGFWALIEPGDYAAGGRFNPTHWMPLPDVPK